MSGWLDKQVFSSGIASLPLVSIDLIVKDKATGRYLFGWRRNRPAANYWFVPGGRIQKNETMSTAFSRLTVNELGSEILISASRFRGVYQHFYDDSVFESSVSTHYVVLSFELELNGCELNALPNQQHEIYRWFTIKELLKEASVHSNSKDYFRNSINYR